MNSVLIEFNKHGKAASYHYADDSTSEWSDGDREKYLAMRLYNENPDLQPQMDKIATGFLWSLRLEKR